MRSMHLELNQFYVIDSTANVIIRAMMLLTRLVYLSSFLLQSLSAQDMIDFSPVYRCLHIYSVLVRHAANSEQLSSDLPASVCVRSAHLPNVHVVVRCCRVPKTYSRRTTENSAKSKHAWRYNHRNKWFVRFTVAIRRILC